METVLLPESSACHQMLKLEGILSFCITVWFEFLSSHCLQTSVAGWIFFPFVHDELAEYAFVPWRSRQRPVRVNVGGPVGWERDNAAVVNPV